MAKLSKDTVIHHQQKQAQGQGATFRQVPFYNIPSFDEQTAP